MSKLISIPQNNDEKKNGATLKETFSSSPPRKNLEYLNLIVDQKLETPRIQQPPSPPQDPSKPWLRIPETERKVKFPEVDGWLSTDELETHFLSLLDKENTDKNLAVVLTFLKKLLSGHYHFALTQLVTKLGLEGKPKITFGGLVDKKEENAILSLLYHPKLEETWASVIEGKEVPFFSGSGPKSKDRNPAIHPLNLLLGNCCFYRAKYIMITLEQLKIAEKLLTETSPNYPEIFKELREALKYKQKYDADGRSSRSYQRWEILIQDAEHTLTEWKRSPDSSASSPEAEKFQQKMAEMKADMQEEAKGFNELYHKTLHCGVQMGDFSCIANQIKDYMEAMIQWNPGQMIHFKMAVLPNIKATTEKQGSVGKIILARLEHHMSMYYQYHAHEAGKIKTKMAGRSFKAPDAKTYLNEALTHGKSCASLLKDLDSNDPSLMLWNAWIGLSAYQDDPLSEDPTLKELRQNFHNQLLRYRQRCVEESLIPSMMGLNYGSEAEVRQAAIALVFPSHKASLDLRTTNSL